MNNLGNQNNLQYSNTSLPRPFFVLAPMDDVTDTVLRQIIADCASPDLFFTEFVNVDGLQSRGRARLIHKLAYSAVEQPLIAQIWGKNPSNYQKVASELVEMGFAGIDINMGCPDKSITRNGCCSALINNRELAIEIINSVKSGVNGKVPVSVKTRLGWNEVDFSWPELLLQQNLSMLTIHGRTKKQMSKVPANWQEIAKICALRDQIAPNTLIVGNGDVRNREHGEDLAKKTGVDGIMIGRAVFNDPYIFAQDSKWSITPQTQKLKMYQKHIKLFSETYDPKIENAKWLRNWEGLKRMAKVYVNGIQDASAFRDVFMRSKSIEELLKHLDNEIIKLSETKG